MNTHGFVMPNGRHKGDLITRVPINYLKWMVNSGHTCAAQAEAELKRRGTVTPELDVSGHAIDKASLRLLPLWKQTAHEEEGLHAWLVRKAQEALGSVPEGEKIDYGGIKFVFERQGRWPVLKTVMPGRAA